MQREDERVDWAMEGGPPKMATVVEEATIKEGSTNITSEAGMWEVDREGEATKNMDIMGITTIRSQSQTLMWNWRHSQRQVRQWR